MLDIKYETDEPSDSDDGDEGGASGGFPSGTAEWEEYLRACLLWERRQEQKRFGPVPLTERPGRLLRKRLAQSGVSTSPHPHPLLTSSQQFSGDDPKLTANPVQNSEAIKRYPQLRLENELRKQLNMGLSKKRNITPSPG